ncbi:hypothetical protein WA158_000239 [Blastocystis sp. Blastoise]
MSSMRGLTNFIQEIRGCTSKEAETARVQKELQNIRANFSKPNVSVYDRKKYVWKIVYIVLLGYEVDFGHMEVITLISAPSFQEKQVGYMACSILFKNTDELFTLIVNSIRNDIIGGVENNQCLALAACANLSGRDLAETVLDDVLNLVTKSTTPLIVKKKSILTLLSLYRSCPDIVGTEWVPRCLGLLEDNNFGIRVATSGLISAVVPYTSKCHEDIRTICIKQLEKLVLNNDCPPNYIYYSVCCPWLTVNCLRILKHIAYPESKREISLLEDILRRILTKTEMTKNFNQNNVAHAILFEAVNLVISYGNDTDEELRASVVNSLGRYISVQEPNIRYLGLEAMSRLALLDGVSEKIQKHQDTILESLNDEDISIRKRALQMLFAMCDEDNAEVIVAALLEHLKTPDFMIKEEMALKVAILAERFTSDYEWYVDTILALISVSGDYVSDDIWHRCVQIVSQQEDLQEYTARKMYEALQASNVHEHVVKLGCYILGEYAELIVPEEEDEEDEEAIIPEDILETLQKHYYKVSLETQAMMISSFAKLMAQFEELDDEINSIFENALTHLDAEIQQRAVEYTALGESDVLEDVLAPMPAFDEDHENVLEMKLHANDEKREGSDDEDDDDDDSDDDSDDDDDDDEEEEEDDEEEEEEEEDEDDGEEQGIDEETEEKMAGWYLNCLIKNKAVLYQDARIQVGIQKSFEGAEGSITFFFTNKGNATLEDFSASIEEVNGLEIEEGEVDDTIEPKGNCKEKVTFESKKPFGESPILTVAFTCKGKSYSLPIPLPVVVLSFSEAIEEMEEDTFDKKFDAISEEKESKQVYKFNEDYDAEGLTEILDTLGLGEVENDSDSKVFAAGTFTTSTVVKGKPATVNFFCKFEFNSKGAVRTTVRASNSVIAKAAAEALKAIIEA